MCLFCFARLFMNQTPPITAPTRAKPPTTAPMSMPVDESEVEALWPKLETVDATSFVPQFDTVVGPHVSESLGRGNASLEQVHEFSSPAQNDVVEQQVLPQHVVPAAQ